MQRTLPNNRQIHILFKCTWYIHIIYRLLHNYNSLKLSSLEEHIIYDFIVSVGHRVCAGFNWVLCFKVLKICNQALARAMVSSEACLGKHTLPSSCGCWQHSVLSDCQIEGFSFLLAISQRPS